MGVPLTRPIWSCAVQNNQWNVHRSKREGKRVTQKEGGKEKERERGREEKRERGREGEGEREKEDEKGHREIGKKTNENY